MKFGYLVFSYSNFHSLEEKMNKYGHYSINLGDYMQTLAVRALYRRIGIADDQTVAVDRDTIAYSCKEDVILPMNACFSDWSFPLPTNVRPIFVGFQTSRAVAEKHRDYFRAHQPIGCRDAATALIFLKLGIKAYITGCLTLTFDKRKKEPLKRCTYVIYGQNAGAFPPQALAYAPKDFWESVEFVSQRKRMTEFPLNNSGMRDAEQHALEILEEYKEKATLAISPLHHAATPCISSGIPFIICRKNNDPRFSFLRNLAPIYLPPDFKRIQWNPDLNDIEPIKLRLTEIVKRRLEREASYAQMICRISD